MNGADEAAVSFERLRRKLTGLAYRMLGSVTEAEDVIQEAYIRWHATDRATIDNPEAFLTTVVTRICLDQLKSARQRRETYVGPWLPEPFLVPEPSVPGPEADVSQDLSVALMLALERLSPLERAAFLLHDVFDVSFPEVAEILGRSPDACRQLATRARERVRSARPRFTVSPEQGATIAEAFFEASRSGDLEALQRLLAEDAVVITDGGGIKPAALRPILGRSKSSRLFAGLARKAGYAKPPVLYRGLINGLPGFITIEKGDTLQSTALDIDEGLIRAIYIVRNPQKLSHLNSELTARN